MILCQRSHPKRGICSIMESHLVIKAFTSRRIGRVRHLLLLLGPTLKGGWVLDGKFQPLVARLRTSEIFKLSLTRGDGIEEFFS